LRSWAALVSAALSLGLASCQSVLGIDKKFPPIEDAAALDASGEAPPPGEDAGKAGAGEGDAESSPRDAGPG